MAHLNISILSTDMKITNAVLVIDEAAASRLEAVLKVAGNLMPGEMLENIASTIKHLGDVKFLSNSSMLKAMEAEAQPIPTEAQPPTIPTFTDEQIVDAATAAHEANKTYCESIGDTSQLPWEQAPDWQKESAINGVKFAISNGFPPPEMMHDNWMAEKLTAGWVYGEVKNADITVGPLTHPCIRPYADLPEDQRRKDSLFRDAIMQSLGVTSKPAPAEPASQA